MLYNLDILKKIGKMTIKQFQDKLNKVQEADYKVTKCSFKGIKGEYAVFEFATEDDPEMTGTTIHLDEFK